MQKYLYLMQSDDGFCKVGVSSNPAQRLLNIRTSSARGVEILATHGPFNLPYAIEAICHAELKEYSVSGEWFNCAPEVASRAIVNCIQQFIDSDGEPFKKNAASGFATLFLAYMDKDKEIAKYKELASQAMALADRTLERFDAMVAERDDALSMVKIHEDIAKSYKILAEKASG